MLREKRLKLLTLGQLALVDHTGRSDESLATRPRKLALLTVLALTQRPLTRDALVEMFWGEQDEARARHSLSDALSHLRRAFGSDAIAASGASVSLAADAPLDVDVHELARAANAGDHARVTHLYGGPFLESIHVGGSESFERWVGRERQRLEQLFLRSAAAHCEILTRTERWDECASLAARWLDAAPTSADAACRLLHALSAPGTRDAALRALAEYQRLSRRLAEDYVLAPEQAVTELAERVREQAQQTMEVPVTTPPVREHVELPPQRRPRFTTREWRTKSRRIWTSAGVVSLAVAVVAFAGARLWAARQTTDGPSPDRPVVAFVPFIVAADTGVIWLGDGLPQMIATALARVPSLELVSPVRVRDARARAALEDRAARAASELTALGRRVGASLVVDGRLVRRDTQFVLDLRVHDVASGGPARLHTLSNANVFALADAAAARVLAAIDARGSGPGLAELETSSVEAYQQYVRAIALWDIGRGGEALQAVDAAIARDSGFVSALYLRLRMAPDTAVRLRLRTAIKRNEARATEWDRLELQASEASWRGEPGRAEALARLLLARFPRDPRAYRLLAAILENTGQWHEADSVMQVVLSLDSLGMEAGRGPCAPCVGYSTLAGLRTRRGDLEGALRAARRWVALQPDLPHAWTTLGWTLAHSNRIDEALPPMRRAAALDGPAPDMNLYVGRLLIMGRRYAQAESVIATLRRSGVSSLATGSFDLRAILERERGQFRRAIATTDTLAMRLAAQDPPSSFSAQLMSGHAIGRLGDPSAAILFFEDFDHGRKRLPVSLANQAAGQRARGFSWHHALEADAVATVADTAYLRALADSVERIGSHSNFGRDWRLHHHIRGLIAARAGRHAEAVREFAAARWEVGGWTRTNVEMARSLLALGHPQDALDVLRQAYITQLDGMGRYAPRSEIDYWMSRAFAAAGARDSAQVYADYVRRAWTNADPEVHRLFPLPHS